jgi:HAD superfamily hydrolase (TIGR01509 family)
MISPQVVVFDLGKVLLEFDFGIVAPKIAARGKINSSLVQKLIDQSPLLFRFETGLMTKEEFYAAICAETGFVGSLEEFSDLFGNIFEPMLPMIELHRSLRKRGIPTYIFSNTNDLAILHIQRHYPFFKDFDGYIFSYEHGAMKPDAKLYEVVERETQRRGPQIIYIDDRAENIAAGAARGWQVILQETTEKTRAALQATGLLG